MENLLIEFINTFDLSLKKFQAEVGDGYEISKLTIHQFQYIDAISGLGEPTITEIAEKLNITKASVTSGINKLVNLGYLIKTQSNQDRRVFHVSLTNAGGRLIKAKYQALKEYGEFIAAALTVEEASQFEGILSKLVKLFKVHKTK
jgi:DNA-binding MarR family transcriptional regulator